MNIIDANIADGATIEVYWQDEVSLDVDVALMYVKSGQKEIDTYVQNVSKPDINNYIETEAKPIVSEVVVNIAEPTVYEYIENTVKPDIDEFTNSRLDTYNSNAEEKTLTFNTNYDSKLSAFNSNADEKIATVNAGATLATEQAIIATTQAETATTSALSASQSASNAKTSETNAKNSEISAKQQADKITSKITVIEGAVGDIGFAPLGIDESLNKRRYLNGQVISQAQFESFTKKIKEAIAVNSNLAATEENWQAEVTNSKLGQCGKFVIDDALGTIRLPKVVNIQGLQDLALMGSIKAESLPNITGKFDTDTGIFSPSGVFSAYKSAGRIGSQGANNNGVSFDASRSSSTYQNNAPVQQEAIQYPYFIQVATGVEESVDVTREIELNNPFFLGMSQYFVSEPNNASWLISNGTFHSGATYVSFYEWLLKIYNGTETVNGVSVKASTDTYDDYDYVINTADTTFRLPSLDGSESLSGGRIVESIFTNLTTALQDYTCPANGFIYVGLNMGAACTLFVYKNGEEIAREGTNATSHNDSAYFSVRKGDVISAKKDTSSTSTTVSYFEYAQGNGSLYYYVGETIQDANVIVASQVLTEVANLKGYTVGIPDYTASIDWSAAGTYAAPSSGWIMGFIRKSGSAANATLYVNNVLVAIAGNDTAASTYWYPINIFIEKGQIYKAEYGASAIKGCVIKFFPCKGAN
jgi:hypothetical protein